jgi:hypothetical protein
MGAMSPEVRTKGNVVVLRGFGHRDLAKWTKLSVKFILTLTSESPNLKSRKIFDASIIMGDTWSKWWSVYPQ